MISIVICTFNREAFLRDVLTSVAELKIVPNQEMELLIIDNNSTDNTRGVVEEASKHISFEVRYVFEPQQGLSYARNRALETARGDRILFTDDDVFLSEDWAIEISHMFDTSDVDIVGGPVLPQWSQHPPAWLKEKDLQGHIVLIDRGNEKIEESECNPFFLVGANMAFRASLFKEIGNFRTDLGVQGNQRYLGEDSEILQRAFSVGKRAIYAPKAIIRHRVDEDRMTTKYFRHWWYKAGKSYVGLSTKWKGLPKWMLRECAQNGFLALWRHLRGRQAVALRSEKEFWCKLGMITELLSNKTSEESKKSLVSKN